MLWFHPVLMTVANLIGFYAAYLGMERFLSQHLELRTQFLWRRHVRFGLAALALWLMGIAGGLIVARLTWQVNFVTGDHYKIAFYMVPLILFGAFSGLYMDRKKARRTILPLLHGIGNLVLLGLALYQFSTGWQIIKDFVL